MSTWSHEEIVERIDRMDIRLIVYKWAEVTSVLLKDSEIDDLVDRMCTALALPEHKELTQ